MTVRKWQALIVLVGVLDALGTALITAASCASEGEALSFGCFGDGGLLRRYSFADGLADLLVLASLRALTAIAFTFSWRARTVHVEPHHERRGSVNNDLKLPLTSTVADGTDPVALPAAARTATVLWLSLNLVFVSTKALIHVANMRVPMAQTKAIAEGWWWSTSIWALLFSSIAIEALRAMAKALGMADADDKKKKKKKKKNADEQSMGRKQPRGASIKALLRLQMPDIPLLAFAFACLCVAAVANGAVPHFVGVIVNALLPNTQDRDQFHSGLMWLCLSAAGNGIFSGLRGGTFIVCMARLNIRIRCKLLHSLLEQEIGFYDATKTGDITSRLSADTTKMSDALQLNVNVFMRSLVSAISVLIFMWALSWRLTLVTFASIPPTVLISKVYGKYYRKLTKATQEAIAKANETAEEALSAMSTVRAFAAESCVEVEYAREMGKFLNLNNRQAAAYTGYCWCFTALPSLVTAIVLVYGGQLVLEGDIDGGALVSFMFYQSQLTDCFSSIGDVFSGLSSALGAADKVFELMNREPDIGAPGTLTLHECRGNLQLQQVQFVYPGRPQVVVLRQVDLHITAGKVVALVGPSGGGKSTVVNLIQRFYEPSKGSVLLDGHEIGEYDPKWLKRHVASVGQEPTLFGRSLRRNILYGLDDEAVPHTKLVEASTMASAHAFISSLPDGYETEAGEKGVQLSGGQKQRVAIARALVRSPSVLLLDEATSALDAESEFLVQAALDDIMRQHRMTILVIAHRLSTIQGADQIVVVEKGQIAAVGTHHDLIADKAGLYAQLVSRQMTTKKPDQTVT